MEIREYTKTDEDALFALMEREGEEWFECWSATGRPRYAKALENATATYVAIEDDQICGFVFCVGTFDVYVDGLLVDKAYRGREIGRLLMERVCTDFPNQGIYVLSDVDEYYSKLGYENIGTVFAVKS